jgi:hypothetical protein
MTRHRDLSDDAVLEDVLSAGIDDLDPVPAAAVAAAAAASDLLHPEGELATLVAESALGEVVLMRDDADHTLLTFAASELTVEIEIDQDHRAVGLITPPAATLIEVETSARTSTPAVQSVRSDDLGRFRMDLAGGLCRLRIGAGPRAVVVTSWFYC